ncbi:MAG: Gfo/Idh/MocA family protein [Candidatus Bathyarchaeia archaeon]
MKLKIGIAGLHNWYHAFPLGKSAKLLPGIDFACVAHENSEQLEQFAQTIGVKDYYSDYEEMFEREEMDAVIITAYTSCHLDLVRKAARRGIHILCDKPLETSIKKAKEIANIVEKDGIKFMMSYPFRYSFVFRKTKELLEKGAIGKPLSIEYLAEFKIPSDWPKTDDPGWYVDPKKAGFGGFIDHSVHQLDAFRHLLGSEAKKVFGIIDNLVYKDLAVDDYGVAIISFENNVHAIIKSTWTGPARQELFSFCGTKGILSANGYQLNLKPKDGEEISYTIPPPKEIVIPVPKPSEESLFVRGKSLIREVDPYFKILEDFAKSIWNKTQPPITVSDGLKSLEAAIAIYESAKSGRIVELP